jgi:hypothetical protein
LDQEYQYGDAGIISVDDLDVDGYDEDIPLPEELKMS